MTQSSHPASVEAGLHRIAEMLVLSRAYRATTTAVALGIFDILATGPKTALQIAQQIQADPRNTQILLDALVALEFMGKSGDQYSNVPLGQRYLTSDSPQSLASNLHYQEILAAAWADLPEVIRSGRPQRALGPLLEDPAFTRQYIRGMANIANRPARELAAQLDLARVGNMLDVGGGPGSYVAAVIERSSRIKAVLLDLAPTLRIAGEILASSSALPNIEFRTADYHHADFGRDAFDLILLSHVTHDEGEEENLSLLARAFTALRPGGQVVIHDFMLAPDRTSPLFGALFSLHMLVYTQKGRTYSAEEYGRWMSHCGFTHLKQIEICARDPNATQALIGIKP